MLRIVVGLLEDIEDRVERHRLIGHDVKAHLSWHEGMQDAAQLIANARTELARLAE